MSTPRLSTLLPARKPGVRRAVAKRKPDAVADESFLASVSRGLEAKKARLALDLVEHIVQPHPQSQPLVEAEAEAQAATEAEHAPAPMVVEAEEPNAPALVEPEPEPEPQTVAETATVATEPSTGSVPSSPTNKMQDVEGVEASIEPVAASSLVMPPLEEAFPTPLHLALQPAAVVLPPRVGRASSRGAALLAMHQRSANLRAMMDANEQAPSPSPPPARTATRIAAEDATTLRMANASHASLMAELDRLARPPVAAAAVVTPPRPTRTSAAATMRSPARSPARPSARLGLPPTPKVLPLPTHFHLLISVFSGLDSALSMVLHRNRGSSSASWTRDLHPAVERTVGKRVYLSHVQQLLSLYPDCYRLTESHYTSSFGKLQADYSIAFGASNGASEEIDSKMHLASIQGSEGTLTNVPVAGQANLTARRAQLDQRMKQYVYEQHQAFLLRLQTEERTATMRIGSTPMLSEVDLSDIAVVLRTPLSGLPVWHARFQVDNLAHCPSPPLEPLPEEELAKLRADAQRRATPISLKQLTMHTQPVPRAIGLESEQRGRRTSSTTGAAAASTVAASSSAPAAAATAAAAPALAHRSLSVLSAEVRARLSLSIQSKRAVALETDGDPALREELRQLAKVKNLYTAVKGRLQMDRRVNMPVPELLTKLRTANPVDYGEAANVRALLALMAQHIPHWCTLGTSGTPPVEVLRTQKRGETDASGADRNIPLLDGLMRQVERKMHGAVKDEPAVKEEPQSEPSAATSSSSTPAVAASAAPTASADDIRVKIEGESTTTASVDVTMAVPTDATVKLEPTVKREATLAAASSHASTIRASTAERLKAALVTSPIKRAQSARLASNISSRASLLASITQPASAAKPKQPTTVADASATPRGKLGHMR